MTTTVTSPLRSGRPRDPQVKVEVIDAVLDLVSEGATLSGLSLVVIAKRAGVSRNSLYRRWATKDELYLDVLDAINQPLPQELTGDVREDLARQLRILAERILDHRASRMLRALNAEAEGYPDLHRRYFRDIVGPRRRALERAIEHAVASGELRSEVDVNLMAELLVSPLLARMASGSVEGLDANETSRDIIDLVFRGALNR